VVQDEIKHGGLGLLLSLAEAIGFIFPLEAVKAGVQSVHIILDRNNKTLLVKKDLVF
jgi:hypothetical protein